MLEATADVADPAFIKRLDEAMIERGQRSVIPLYTYAHEHDHTRPLGTGTLVRLAEKSFLVTAAHVLREANDKAPDALLTADLWGGNRSFGIGGAAAVGVSKELDIGILELSADAVGALDGFHFLRLSEIDYAATVAPQGWHYVHGYPMVWTKSKAKERAFTSRMFTHLTTIIERPETGLGNYNPAFHLILDIGREVRNLDGTPGEVPEDYKGISGSAVWRAHRFDQPVARWTAEDMRCVAVQTGVYPQADRVLVKATRWVYVAGLLRLHYPELIPVFDLHDAARPPSPLIVG